MLDNGAVFQELWDDILEGKVDSEIGGQVTRVQTQKQSFNFQKQPPRAVLRNGVLKICSKFTGEHPSRMRFLKSCKETLLKSHFGNGVLL